MKKTQYQIDAENKCIDILAKMKVRGEITAKQYSEACNDVRGSQPYQVIRNKS